MPAKEVGKRVVIIVEKVERERGPVWCVDP